MDVGAAKLNWKEVDPPDFAWVLATGADSKPNVNFADQWSQLAKGSIPRGAYHEAVPSHHCNPVEDARLVYRMVGQLRHNDQIATKVVSTDLKDVETVRWLCRHYETLSTLYPEHAYLVTTPAFLASLGNLRSLADASVWLVGDGPDFPQWQSAGTAASVVAE